MKYWVGVERGRSYLMGRRCLFSLDFPTNSQQDAPFHRIAYDCFCADWDGLRDHLRDFPWENIFKLGASAAASEFCE